VDINPQCTMRQELFDNECRLRSKAKIADEFKRQVALAQAALLAERTRRAHERSCEKCLLEESEAAA
jgi:hypothetical protein